MLGLFSEEEEEETTADDGLVSSLQNTDSLRTSVTKDARRIT
jgi:hypothetical protein